MYSFESQVRYSEIDQTEQLSVTALVNYFQDCSTFQSAKLHVGVDELTEVNRGWVLSAWQIVIRKRPRLLDQIKVNTWAYGFQKFMGMRNFTMEDSEGNVIACADSLWVLIDTQTTKPVIPKLDFHNVYKIEPRYEGMNYEGRKISYSHSMIPMTPFMVKKHQLDVFSHVNNVQYIQMAEEYLPDGYEFGQVRVEYKLSARDKDIIYPYVQAEEDKRFVVELKNEHGRVFALVEFEKI